MARDSYLDPYRRSYRRHGATFAVTHWASRRNQLRRFEVMARMVNLSGKRVLDAGCSRGDFAEFLIECGIAFEHFVGVDALPEVIAFAAERAFARCEFICGDFLTDPALLRHGDPQVVCLSGALNTMTDAQVDTVLSSAWAAAGETFVFNFLSDRATLGAPPQFRPVRRLDTLRLMDWALAQTPHVGFRHDYFRHGHDATIVMRKPREERGG